MSKLKIEVKNKDQEKAYCRALIALTNDSLFRQTFENHESTIDLLQWLIHVDKDVADSTKMKKRSEELTAQKAELVKLLDE